VEQNKERSKKKPKKHFSVEFALACATATCEKMSLTLKSIARAARASIAQVRLIL
jgi:hypothetical protein